MAFSGFHVIFSLFEKGFRATLMPLENSATFGRFWSNMTRARGLAVRDFIHLLRHIVWNQMRRFPDTLLMRVYGSIHRVHLHRLSSCGLTCGCPLGCSHSSMLIATFITRDS